MNNEIWTAEEAQRLGACLTSMRKQTRYNRLATAVNFTMIIFYPVLGGLMTYTGDYALAAVNFGLAGVFVVLARSTRHRRKFWRSCSHHMQRMLVETPERVVWHSAELMRLFDHERRKRE